MEIFFSPKTGIVDINGQLVPLLIKSLWLLPLRYHQILFCLKKKMLVKLLIMLGAIAAECAKQAAVVVKHQILNVSLNANVDLFNAKTKNWSWIK